MQTDGRTRTDVRTPAGFAFERRPIRRRRGADADNGPPRAVRPPADINTIFGAGAGGRRIGWEGTVREFAALLLSFVSQQQTPLQIVLDPSQPQEMWLLCTFFFCFNLDRTPIYFKLLYECFSKFKVLVAK